MVIAGGHILLEFHILLSNIAKKWFTQHSLWHRDPLRVPVMLKHSNSAVTSVSLRNSIFVICPDFPRIALGNVWVSPQAEDPQVAWLWKATNGILQPHSNPGKIPLGNLISSHQRLGLQGISEFASIPTLPLDPAWVHSAMISGSVRLWINHFTWELSHLVHTKILHLA